jgi:hypothetical protein
MTLKELRRYVLAHREDSPMETLREREAWDEFAACPRPNAVMVAADTPVEEQERILKELVYRSK